MDSEMIDLNLFTAVGMITILRRIRGSVKGVQREHGARCIPTDTGKGKLAARRR